MQIAKKKIDVTNALFSAFHFISSSYLRI